MPDSLNNPAIKLTYDVSDFVTGADKVIDKMEEIDEASEETQKQIDGDMKDAVKATDEVNRALAKEVNAVKEVAKERKAEADQLKKNIKDYKVFGVSLNDIKDKYKAVTGGVRGAWTELKTLTTVQGKAAAANKVLVGGLKLFKLALIGTGIGAILVLFGSLVAYFTRTQSGINKVNQVLAGFGATIDVIIDRASSVGKALIDAFTKPKEALSSLWEGTKNFFSNPIDGLVNLFNGAKDAAAGLVEEIKEEANAAVELTKQRQNLIAVERDLRIATAETRAEIKALNLIGEDTTKSIQVRQDATRKAIGLEQNLMSQRIDLAEQELAILEAQNALGESLDADLEREADLVVEVATLKQESLELQTTLQNKLNTLTAEEIRNRLALEALYANLYDGLKEQLQTVGLEIEENPMLRLVKEQEIALAALEKQKTELLKVAKAVGGDVDGIIQAYDDLADGIKESFTQKIEKELASLEPEIKLEEVKIELDENTDFDFKTEVPENFEQKVALFKKNLFKSLNLTPEDVAIIEDSLAKVFELAFVDTSRIDARIAENDKYRQSLKDTTKDLESELEVQARLKAEGLDNDFTRVNEALNRQKALEQDAIREAEELQKQKAKAELTGQIASQIGNLATAATKIFSAHAGIPFAGIALALGAIATMYSSYKSFKEQATAEIRLYKGTGQGEAISDYFGYPAKGGASDIPGRGRGYRIEGTNVRISGNEFLNTERAAELQGAFLYDLNVNPDKYEGVDLKAIVEGLENGQRVDISGLMKGYQTAKGVVVELGSSASRSNESHTYDALIAEAVNKSTEEIVKAIAARPHYYTHKDKLYKHLPGLTTTKKLT